MNHTPNTPPRGNIPLPVAAIKQWAEADSEDTASSWNYVAGLLAGCMIYRTDFTEELTFLHSIAAIRANMAAKGNTSTYASFTPKQRLDALSDAVSRMKSHSVVLGQFFVRPTTKKTALAGMDTEISNMLVLWALVKADLEVQS